MKNPLFRFKENHPRLWQYLEQGNGVLFRLFFGRVVKNKLTARLQEASRKEYNFRWLKKEDLPALAGLLDNLEPDLRSFFEPHPVDYPALKKVLKTPSFFMLGVFDSKDELLGYFFLRCFLNKKCFVGRYVAGPHRNRGIGKTMNRILYHTAWDAGFRCFATFSPENKLIMKAHASNPCMQVRKTLSNGYLLVEFVKPVDQ